MRKQEKNPANTHNVIVLFSLGIPLKLWHQRGLAAREKAYYDHFIKQGHEVSLFTYGKDDLEYQNYWQPIKVLPWLGKLNHFVKYACLAPFYHRSAFKQADIVKSNQSQGSLVGFIAKVINPKLKFVLRCGWVRTKEVIKNEESRTGIKYYRAVFFEWLAVKLANAIIVVTQSDANYLIEHYSANKNKIHIIPNSIDTDCYQYVPSGFSEGKPIKILLVGRLVAAKNFDKVFQAVAQLERDIEINIAGDGDYRQALEQEAQELNVNATFVGSVPNDELATLYSEHDLVIMPEAWGSGMPKVVLEAMASGAVIIASNIRSVQQLLRHGENGFICEPKTQSIKTTLEQVLTLPNKQLQTIVQTARHEIENQYSMQYCVTKELALYDALRAHK